MVTVDNDMIPNNPTDELAKLSPIIATFYDLAHALAPLHIWHEPDLKRLHDLWVSSAPVPNSRVLNPKGYDERKVQDGNYVARIIPPPVLAQWVMDVSQRRGMPYTTRQALNLVSGQADLHLDKK